jgi:heme exporter protein CcmD
MPDLGPHAVFIVAAYLGVFFVTVGLIAAIVVNGRAKRKKLMALEAKRKPEARG